MARIIKQLKDFRQGMTPFLSKDGGIARLEHFDTTLNTLRPFSGLASTTATGYNNISKFTKSADTIFALARQDHVSDKFMSILVWSGGNQTFSLHESAGSNGTYASVIIYYNGYFFGLWAGTHLWRITSGGVNLTYQARTYTNYADFLIHSKDGLLYIPTDNILSVFNGSSLTTGLTLPTYFVITSIAEQGDYIMIVGYDSKTNNSTAYLWDRDSSLATLTAKYDLGSERALHNATISGTPVIISIKTNTSNTDITEKESLIIRALSGDKFVVLNEYIFDDLGIGGKFIDNNGLYFTGAFQEYGGSSEFDPHCCVFKLDNNLKLSIAHNLAVNDTSGSALKLTGLLRDGDGFWIGGGTDGAWNTVNNYGTASIIEINPYEAQNLANNIDVVGITLTYEALPNGAEIKVYSRADSTLSWGTAIATFDENDSVKGSATCQDLSTAKTRQFRIESTGGATITGWQAMLEEKPDECYN